METSGAFTVFLRSIVYLLYLCSMLPIHSMIDTSEKLFQIFTFHYVTRKKQAVTPKEKTFNFSKVSLPAVSVNFTCSYSGNKVN